MSRFFTLLLIGSLIANVLLAIVFYNNSDVVKSAEDFKQAQEKYPLLSKRILQEYPLDILLNFLDLRRELQRQTAPYGSTFGLYFEYLPTGTSVGINANNEFYAASLFKVPVIMAYYHGLERTGGTDDKILTIKKEFIDNEFGDLWKKGEGYKIESSEAVRLAMVESDNTAAKILSEYVTDEDFEAVYEALDIDLHADQHGASVSARTYSSILKALYFSSVISKENSQKLLTQLTKTKFPDKLEAGVPEGISVAHKIGNFNDSNGNEGFRDCGIVYVPRRPYVVCMFSVSDEQTARERMQLVSKTIYDYVAKEKQNDLLTP